MKRFIHRYALIHWIARAFNQFFQDRCLNLAAGIAFYTAFSFAPILVIILAIASTIFDFSTTHNEVFKHLHTIIGQNAANSVQNIVHQAYLHSHSRGIATIISTIALLIGASATFNAIHNAFLVIWPNDQKPHSEIKNIIRVRLISLALILGIGILLILMLIVSTVLSFINHYIWHNNATAIMMNLISTTVGFVILTSAFTSMLKFLPSAKVRIQNALIGGTISAVLFIFGKNLFALYLAKTGTANMFGAAGSLAVLLMWLYFSSSILLLGAEFAATWQPRSSNLKHHSSSK